MTLKKEYVLNQIDTIKSELSDLQLGQVPDSSITDVKLDPNGIKATVEQHTTDIGTMANLETTDKTSLVAAINENSDNIGTNTSSIGVLANLTTTEKTNIVGSVNELVSDLVEIVQVVPSSTNTTGLQNALNSISGGIVCLGDNQYTLTSQVSVKDNITFQGIKGKTIITSSVRMNSDILLDTAIINDKTVDINCITFKDLTFLGGVSDTGTFPRVRSERTIPTQTFRRGIHLDGTTKLVKNVYIDNCTFKNLEDFPFLLTNVENVYITNCHFYNCIDIGFVGCKNIVFTGNIIEKSADNGVSISRLCENAVVSDNIVKDCAYAGIWLSGWSNQGSGEIGVGTNKFNCINNVIDNCGHFGIQLTDAPKNGTISGNTITNIKRGTTGEPNDFRGVGIKISSYPEVDYTIAGIVYYAENLTIANNNIVSCLRGGVEIRGLKVGSINNNTIRDCGSVYLTDGTTAISNTSTEQNFGIRMYIYNELVDIFNNRIIDTTGNAIIKYPIIFVNDTYNTNKTCRIKGNKAYGTYNNLVSGLTQDTSKTNLFENYYDFLDWNSGLHNVWKNGDTEFHFFNDSDGNLKIKTTQPGSNLDGTILFSNRFQGKKIGFFGDSITATSGWLLVLTRALGMTYANNAVSGSGYTIGGANSIASLSNTSTVSDLDYVVIWSGTNDFGNNVVMGADTSTNVAEFCGGVNTALTNLLTRKPTLKIILITPMWRTYGGTSDSDTSTNTVPLYLKDYSDKLVTLGAKYHVPVINLYDSCVVNKFNYSTYLTDGLHPVAFGSGGELVKVIGNRVASFISRNF